MENLGKCNNSFDLDFVIIALRSSTCRFIVWKKQTHNKEGNVHVVSFPGSSWYVKKKKNPNYIGFANTPMCHAGSSTDRHMHSKSSVNNKNSSVETWVCLVQSTDKNILSFLHVLNKLLNFPRCVFNKSWLSFYNKSLSHDGQYFSEFSWSGLISKQAKKITCWKDLNVSLV